MPAVNLDLFDLSPFATIEEEKAQLMIDDALALAALVAPCILEDTFTHAAAAKAILRGAILRWNESGTGASVQQSAGPFSQTMDTRQQRRSMFWPTEIEQLQELCKQGGSSGAFALDTLPAISNQTIMNDCFGPWPYGGI